MSTGFGILLMMNNYFHDVATALLLASGAVMWAMTKGLVNAADKGTVEYFLAIYRKMTLFAGIALAWIVIGGIPRTIYYREYEWANAAGKGQVPALIVKHLLFFVLVGAGTYIWIKLRKRVTALKEK